MVMASIEFTVLFEVLTLRVASGILPAMFSFCICSQLKGEKSNFLTDFFLSLTAFVRVASFLTLSSKRFLSD